MTGVGPREGEPAAGRAPAARTTAALDRRSRAVSSNLRKASALCFGSPLCPTLVTVLSLTVTLPKCKLVLERHVWACVLGLRNLVSPGRHRCPDSAGPTAQLEA